MNRPLATALHRSPDYGLAPTVEWLARLLWKALGAAAGNLFFLWAYIALLIGIAAMALAYTSIHL